MSIAMILSLQVLCIGDSLTMWPDSYCDQSKHETVNLGQPGRTTSNWRNAFFNEVLPALQAQHFDVVSILLTTNNARDGVSAETTESDLGFIIYWLGRLDVDDVVLSIPPHVQTEGHLPWFGKLSVAEINSHIDTYAPIIERLAATRPVARLGVDWRKLDLSYPRDWADPVHLNASGLTVGSAAMDSAGGPVDASVPEPGRAGLLGLGLACRSARVQRTHRAPALAQGRTYEALPRRAGG